MRLKYAIACSRDEPFSDAMGDDDSTHGARHTTHRLAPRRRPPLRIRQAPPSARRGARQMAWARVGSETDRFTLPVRATRIEPDDFDRSES